ncbi:MAG: tetratricopeptide repeat protein [Bacteroidales bacterium]|nr:tetratricopeptide repeat protein [Candidatus Cacconaster merdequi]
MILNKYIFALLAAVSITLSIPFAASAQSDNYLLALEALTKGRKAEARTLLEKEISENQNNDAAYYYLSTALNFREEPELTEYYLKKAVELDPGNFWYKYNLAIFYANTDRSELTTRMLEELIADYPKKSSLYFDLANLYVSQNEIDKAIDALDRIESRSGKNEAIGVTKFELMMKREDADVDSVYSYLKEYYDECKTPRLAAMMGDYYLRTYRDSLALVYYDEATEMDNGYTPAYYGKAHIYQGRRQYEKFFENLAVVSADPSISPEAKAEYLSTLTESPQFIRAFSKEIDSTMILAHEAHPMDTTINTLLSSYYYKTGRPYLTSELLKQNTDNHPDSFSAAQEYLIFIYYQKAWPVLYEESTTMLQRFENSHDFLQLRAIASSMMDNEDAAIEDYLQIVKLKPKDTLVTTMSYSSIGDLYYKKGEPSKAFSYYEKALKQNPRYCPTLNNYAYYLSLEGKRLKKAKQMSKKTIEAEPDNPTYLDTYAWILHLMGEDVEAKAIFKHAMLYGGKESAETLRHYSEVLSALGEYDLARIYLNQAKSLER